MPDFVRHREAEHHGGRRAGLFRKPFDPIDIDGGELAVPGARVHE
jgi:hypothetical protein